MYIFKHSLFRLKITVGCLTSTYPSIHVETLKITVGCLVCGVVCVVWCAGVLWWCVLLCCGGACVVCGEAWHTLSLWFSLLPLLFPFLSLSYLSFSLFFFLFFFSCSFSYSCSCSQRRLLPPPLPPLLESVNTAANKVSTKSAFEDV